MLADHHVLGMRIVRATLSAAGYEATDYGHGIGARELAERALADGIEVLLVSTLMLPSALQVSELSTLLRGQDSRIKLVVGGAPFLFDKRLWREVGADAMGRMRHRCAADRYADSRRCGMSAAMTSLQRVLTTLGHREPDRVPRFLLLTMHGARELNLSIREYFSEAKHVVAGQLRMRARYGNDCLYPFFYAAIEVEAMGGEVIFVGDGPPNAGRPLIGDPEAIPSLVWPDPAASPVLPPGAGGDRRAQGRRRRGGADRRGGDVAVFPPGDADGI